MISVVRFVLAVFDIESIYILEPAYEVPDPSFYLPFEMFFILIQTMPKPILQNRARFTSDIEPALLPGTPTTDPCKNLNLLRLRDFNDS